MIRSPERYLAIKLSRTFGAPGIVPRVESLDIKPGGDGTPEVGVTATVAEAGESPSALTAIKLMLYVVPGVNPKIYSELVKLISAELVE